MVRMSQLMLTRNTPQHRGANNVGLESGILMVLLCLKEEVAVVSQNNLSGTSIPALAWWTQKSDLLLWSTWKNDVAAYFCRSSTVFPKMHALSQSQTWVLSKSSLQWAHGQLGRSLEEILRTDESFQLCLQFYHWTNLSFHFDQFFQIWFSILINCFVFLLLVVLVCLLVFGDFVSCDFVCLFSLVLFWFDICLGLRGTRGIRAWMHLCMLSYCIFLIIRKNNKIQSCHFFRFSFCSPNKSCFDNKTTSDMTQSTVEPCLITFTCSLQLDCAKTQKISEIVRVTDNLKWDAINRAHGDQNKFFQEHQWAAEFGQVPSRTNQNFFESFCEARICSPFKQNNKNKMFCVVLPSHTLQKCNPFIEGEW